MSAKDINQTYDLLTIAQGDSKLKHAGKYYIGACPFCGGTDRFNLLQTTNGWRWLCRNCTEARYKSSIDYIMRRDDMDFKQALEAMGGKGSAPAPGPRTEQAKPDLPAIVLPDETWQAQRWHEITIAGEALTTHKQARAYLESRALDPAMWESYLLGFEMAYCTLAKKKRPAITIPWYDTDETITLVKYRFIDELAKDKSYRFTSRGKAVLFGLHNASGNKTLILTEGEFNAMSITQVSACELLHIDALSFGSETAAHVEILNAVANDYQHVIIWADDPEHANAIRLSLSQSADAICSPEIDGIKYDANTLLQNGYLGEFLRETIKHPSPTHSGAS